MMRPEPARPAPKGWCPGAHRPMESGDGWIVRVKPRLACLTAEQLQGIARLSLAFGNGVIDLTSRANLQIRGLQAADVDPLLVELSGLTLLDPDAATESRRNVICAPDWQPGDDTARLTETLLQRLEDLPVLPAKFGFAIDAGIGPILSGASADVRIERSTSGGLVLRADGRAMGAPVNPDQAIDRLIALAHWFHEVGGTGRMAQVAAALPDWATPTESPAPARAPLMPGLSEAGACIGFAFGQISAQDLLSLPPVPVRLTPWRVLVLFGQRQMPVGDGFLTDSADPSGRIDACPGAPACGSASVATRDLARALARTAPAHSLHVSGCAKGCARASAADVTLVGRNGRFDVVRHGTAWDMPVQTGIAPEDISSVIHAL